MSLESRTTSSSSSKQAPRVISVGGGPGGVGKSLLTVNLSVYLAQLGRSVIIADVDPASAGLHTMLGLDPQRRPSPNGWSAGRSSAPPPSDSDDEPTAPPI